VDPVADPDRWITPRRRSEDYHGRGIIPISGSASGEVFCSGGSSHLERGGSEWNVAGSWRTTERRAASGQCSDDSARETLYRPVAVTRSRFRCRVRLPPVYSRRCHIGRQIASSATSWSCRHHHRLILIPTSWYIKIRSRSVHWLEYQRTQRTQRICL